MAMMGILLLLLIIVGVATALYIIFTLVKMRIALGLAVIFNALRINDKKKGQKTGEVVCGIVALLCMAFFVMQLLSLIIPVFKLAFLAGGGSESIHKQIWTCADEDRYEDMCELFAENADVSSGDIDDILDVIDGLDMTDAEFVIEDQLEVTGNDGNRSFTDNDAYRYELAHIYREDYTPVFIDIFCMEDDERDSGNDGLWLIVIYDVDGNVVAQAGEELPYSIRCQRGIDWRTDDKGPVEMIFEMIKTGDFSMNENVWESYVPR